jgi:hypothetical protein
MPPLSSDLRDTPLPHWILVPPVSEFMSQKWV